MLSRYEWKYLRVYWRYEQQKNEGNQTEQYWLQSE